MRDAAAYAALLRRREPFAYAKINHGFWERLIREEERRAKGADVPVDPFDAELLEMLQTLPRSEPPIDFGAGPLAWPGSEGIGGYPRLPIATVEALIAASVPAAAQTADPLVWRTSLHDGGLVDVIEALRGRQVVVVGPDWTGSFGAFARLPRCRHVAIHATQAKAERVGLAARLTAEHRPDEEPVYLVQAGSLSAWLVIRLAPVLPRATFLDLGTTLDLCNLTKISRWLWARVDRHAVAAAVMAINPDWPADPRSAPGTSPEARQDSWAQFAEGIIPGLAERVGIARRGRPTLPLDLPDVHANRVRFVEAKRPDWNRIEEISALSARDNQWANFGPTAAALERELERTLDLPASRAVVVASSATAATFALAGLAAERLGRPVRWAASAFGFMSTAAGPLAGTRFVDCDADGMIDLAALDKLPPSSWDGLIVTNLFGLHADLGRYVDFATARGKALLVDGAVAFTGVDRRRANADEVVSLHHTKPPGFGEGGFAIVARADAARVRAMLNFGVGADEVARPFFANGKMSEIAAAAILDRLERLPTWSGLYRAQHARLLYLARYAGLEPLASHPDGAIAGNIPILLRAPWQEGDLPPVRFETRRYYRPLSSDAPVAADLYSRMINIPCHPGMAAIRTEEMLSFFTALARHGRGSKPRPPRIAAPTVPAPRWWQRWRAGR